MIYEDFLRLRLKMARKWQEKGGENMLRRFLSLKAKNGCLNGVRTWEIDQKVFLKNMSKVGYNHHRNQQRRDTIQYRAQKGATFIGLDTSLLIVPGVVPFC